MKHPVLPIKKDAEIYVDPETGEGRQRSAFSAPRAFPSRGVFFRSIGRRSRFPLFAVLFIALAALVLPRILFRGAGRASVEGWNAILRASPSKDALYVSISLSRGPRGLPTPDVSVLFLLPDTGERAFVSKALSRERSTLRAVMSYTGKERSVEADVRIGSETRRLSVGIRKP